LRGEKEMNIWRTISGIFSIVLSFFVVFQSFCAGLLNPSTVSYKNPGTVILIMAALLIVGGVVSIAVRDAINNLGNASLIAVYGASAIGGYLLAEGSKTLMLCATWCLLCAVMAAIAIAADNVCGALTYVIIGIAGLAIVGSGLGVNFFGKDDIQTNSNEDKEITQISNSEPESDESEDNREVEEEIKLPENCDFRNVKWGDSKKTVRLYESDINFTHEEDDYLMGEVSISGYNSLVFYDFQDDKLYSGFYVIEPDTYTNPGQYISTHNSIKSQLIEKYGQPISSDIIPLNEADLIEYAGPADALNFGYVQYWSTWETESSTIDLTMDSKEFDIALMVIYTDKNYEEAPDPGL